MNHPWHRHPLRLNREEGRPFECSGCKELDFGTRYQCVKNCHFVLHEDCFKARPEDRSRVHPLMGSCRFQFLWGPPGGPNRRLCDACGRDIRGFVYHDKYRHKLDLHPCCMNLKSTMSDPYGRMRLILKDQMPSRCVKCERKDLNVMAKGPFRGWSYVSSCGSYCYHVYCVKKLVLDNWQRGYFNVSSSSSSRGRSMFRDDSGSSSRSNSVQSYRSISSSSFALARRGSSRPAVKAYFALLIKMVKVGFSVLVSVLFGNPTPLFAALAENLLN